MARTLVAGAKAPAPVRPDRQTDCLALIWSCLAELYMIGDRYRRLAPARARLDAQLNQQVQLEPAERHPLYGEACQRYERWSAELHGHDRRAERLVANLSRHLEQLSPANLAALTAHAGWVTGEPGEIAEAMWERAKAGGVFPSGEPPFLLTPLLDWVEAQMQRERDAIYAFRVY